jgi:hypothetical protein
MKLVGDKTVFLKSPVTYPCLLACGVTLAAKQYQQAARQKCRRRKNKIHRLVSHFPFQASRHFEKTFLPA